MVVAVTKWLEQLGLGSYAPVFAEQQIALDLARRSGSAELEAHAYAGLARAS